MSIPSQSNLLIIGINYASLILGAMEAKLGVNVLLIDKEIFLDNQRETLILDEYDTNLLNHYGFVLDGNNLSTSQIQKQASKLLANSLCNILWGIKREDIEGENDLFMILSDTQNHIKHTTQFVLYGEDLLLSTAKATLKNLAILSWKIEGYLSGLCNLKLLNNHQVEKEIIQDYFKESKNRLSLFERIKIFQKRKTKVLSLKESRINLHLSQYRGTEAGDLLPNLEVFDEKLKKDTSFYNWCRFGNYSMIMLGYISKQNLFHTARWLNTNYPVRLFYLPPTEKNQHIFDFFNIIEGEKKTLIIRPDRFVAFISDRIDLDIISNYLSDLLLLNAQVKTNVSKKIGDETIENYP